MILCVGDGVLKTERNKKTVQYEISVFQLGDDTLRKMNKLERFYEELMRALHKATNAQSLIRVNMISTNPYYFRYSI